MPGADQELRPSVRTPAPAMRRICTVIRCLIYGAKRYTNVSKLTKCEACTRVVADAHFALRRRVTPPHALSSIEATDALETLCSDSYRRYDDAPNLMEKVCEDMMDGHVMQLLKVGEISTPPAPHPPHHLAQAAQSPELPSPHAACAGNTHRLPPPPHLRCSLWSRDVATQECACARLHPLSCDVCRDACELVQQHRHLSPVPPDLHTKNPLYFYCCIPALAA